MTRARGFRQALAAYVRGHDRVWTPEAMRGGVAPVAEAGPEWGAPVPRRVHDSPEVPDRLHFRRGPAISTPGAGEADHHG